MENFNLDLDTINTNFLEPLRRLTSNEGELSENLRDMSPVLEEVGRIIYSNNAVTINLAWALAAILGLGLLLLKLFFGLTLFDVMDAMTGATPHYGGTGYGAPATGYGAPAQSYGAPSTGYAAPASGYSSRSSYDEDDVQLTPEQKALYPELTKLQEQLDQLKESEVNLRHQIFYNSDNDVASDAIGHIGYSY